MMNKKKFGVGDKVIYKKDNKIYEIGSIQTYPYECFELESGGSEIVSVIGVEYLTKYEEPDYDKAIKEWATDKGLDKAEPSKQMLKLIEEVGELASGIAKNKEEVIKDSLGDVYVVLLILSLQLGYDLDKCIAQAYNEIKNRKGKLQNGVFVKESDLDA